MFIKMKLALLLLIAAVLLAGCGGGGVPAITGLKVTTYPSDGIGYVVQTPPWNQVSFTAYYYYRDGTIGTTPVAGVQWTGDPQAYWISIQGNVATCWQPVAPRAIVTGTANANGVVLTGTAAMWCM
jgi:hypothetical protein